MQRKIITMLTILIISVLTLSACGRGNNSENNRADGGTGDGGIGGTIGAANTPHNPDAPTLTIASGQMWNEQRMSQTANTLRERLAGEGTDINVEFISFFNHEERDEHFALMLSKFAAGVGPDIMVRDNFPIYQLVENDFLADIFPMIDNSPNLGRDDFFANVLDGYAIDGRLYVLPMQFGFEYVGINTNVPQEFLNRFTAMDRASMNDLVNLYLDLIDTHPEWAELAIADNFHFSQILNVEVRQALDFTGRRLNLTGQPVLERLETARRAFEYSPTFDTPWVQHMDNEHMALLQSQYVFHMPRSFALDALFEFQEPFFTNYLPMADISGRLLESSWGMELVVSHTADPDLAWAFIEQFITDTWADNFSMGAGNAPITRRYFREIVEGGFRGQLQFAEIRPLLNSESASIQAATDRIARYAEMSVVQPSQNLLLPWYVLSDSWEYVSNFQAGTISAGELAAHLEETITAWLNAERPIEPFIPPVPPDPQDDPDYGLPVRSITILTSNEYTAVIQQAANAMNASWRERGEPYAFRVEIDEYDHQDWENREARHTRLNTMLMAGQGPDMFIYGRQNIRAMAERGFLADIYALMDAATHTGRDDFFTQPLMALEISGGLFKFPVSFGFEYVGINGNLPQPLIDRFAGYSIATPSLLRALYSDLKANHRDEFGYLINGFPTAMNQISFFMNLLEDFIDFGTRTSYVNTPQFIAEMVEMRQFFDSLFTRDYTFSRHFPISREDTHRDFARDFVFRAESGGLNPAFGLLPFDNPHFRHFIPMADDQGRLMIDARGGAFGDTWAAVCITATGNSALAWEFTQYLVYAFVNPVGRAATSLWGGNASWGAYSLSMPISRSLFRPHMQAALEQTYNRSHGWTCIGRHSSTEQAANIEAAINRLATFAEMPMRSVDSALPWEFIMNNILEPYWQFTDGIIPAYMAAQRMHNSIAIWLIES